MGGDGCVREQILLLRIFRRYPSSWKERQARWLQVTEGEERLGELFDTGR